jgi:hypothetical protein
LVQTVMMDRQADEQTLFCECRRPRGMILLTRPPQQRSDGEAAGDDTPVEEASRQAFV